MNAHIMRSSRQHSNFWNSRLTFTVQFLAWLAFLHLGSYIISPKKRRWVMPLTAFFACSVFRDPLFQRLPYSSGNWTSKSGATFTRYAPSAFLNRTQISKSGPGCGSVEILQDQSPLVQLLRKIIHSVSLKDEPICILQVRRCVANPFQLIVFIFCCLQAG